VFEDARNRRHFEASHGILQKVPRTHRYQVTTAGRKAITAILTARQATIAQLTKAA
jgi:hypothetical protein